MTLAGLEHGAVRLPAAELGPPAWRGRAARQRRAARIALEEARAPRLFPAGYDAGTTDPQEPQP